MPCHRVDLSGQRWSERAIRMIDDREELLTVLLLLVCCGGSSSTLTLLRPSVRQCACDCYRSCSSSPASLVAHCLLLSLFKWLPLAFIVDRTCSFHFLSRPVCLFCWFDSFDQITQLKCTHTNSMSRAVLRLLIVALFVYLVFLPGFF